MPLDIALPSASRPGTSAADVKQALLRAFSNADLPGGQRGFFHPDNFTFGQPVYLSQIVAAAMERAGRHLGAPGAPLPAVGRERARGEIERAGSRSGRLEIARLDNDPNEPENGRIEFVMEGGL